MVEEESKGASAISRGPAEEARAGALTRGLLKKDICGAATFKLSGIRKKK